MTTATGRLPRFVLLEHCWDGCHWDLMLEAGNSLRTWALSSPPTDSEEILATSLPDHRLDYLDYEGPISNDRGSVRRLDRGFFELITWEDDLVRVRFLGDQVIGEAEFRRISDRCWRFMIGKFI